MPRMRRKWLLITIGMAAAMLVGMGGYLYFVGTNRMLEHAEAFALRRMSVSQLSEQGLFRFFYATNRVPIDEQAPIEERFSSKRGDTLGFGAFDTRIEPNLGLGMLINPSDWFLNEEIQLQAVRTLEREQFVAQIRAQVEASPYRSLLVVVHGFREAYPSALRKTAFLSHILDIDTPVLLFDWPGDQGSSLRGYRRARGVAKASAAELAETLALVIRQVQPRRLWLLANSMGAQVVVDAFHVLYRDADLADVQTEIENLVLTAADADHAQFNNQFKDEIKALADKVTVYVSSNDRALLVSRLINRGQRLGESTLDPRNPGQAQQAASLSRLLEPGDERLVLVDVTPVNRTRNFHNFSLETPEFFDDLFLRFTGTELPQTRGLYFLQTPAGVRYFVLTRGR
jgi:esterase/lipase superfamily enzyme